VKRTITMLERKKKARLGTETKDGVPFISYISRHAFWVFVVSTQLQILSEPTLALYFGLVTAGAVTAVFDKAT